MISHVMKFSMILFIVLGLKLVEVVAGGKKNVVIVNNKPMTYNRKGVLVDYQSEEEMNGSGAPVFEKTKVRPNHIGSVSNSNVKVNPNLMSFISNSSVELSPSFMSHAFVPNSSVKVRPNIMSFVPNTGNGGVKGASNELQGTIITKGAVITKLPSRKSQKVKGRRPSTTAQKGVWNHNIHHPTPPGEVVSSGISSFESSSQNTIYNDAFKNDFKKFQPITERPRFKPLGYSNENPVVYYYPPPPPPPSNYPYYYTSTTTALQPNQYQATTAMPIMDHFMQNLDVYRKILAPNCSFPRNENSERTSEQVVVQITPKPVKEVVTDPPVKVVKVVKAPVVQKVQLEYVDDVQGKTDIFKKCKCSHEHHGHHHHHHKHSHEKYSHEKHSQ